LKVYYYILLKHTVIKDLLENVTDSAILHATQIFRKLQITGTTLGACEWHPTVQVKTLKMVTGDLDFMINFACLCLLHGLVIKCTENFIPSVTFEVFMAVTMKNADFWDVTSRGSCKNRRFGGT
jgi:hypothetical protein